MSTESVIPEAVTEREQETSETESLVSTGETEGHVDTGETESRVSTSETEGRSSTIATVLMWLGLLVITGVGIYYRFSQIELKPLHHDEGVNGWFILKILDEYKYRYNPKNYHGPLLYFLNTIAVIIGGRTVTAMRVMPAAFGALAIPTMALFRRYIGVVGVLVAAAFVAVAPVEVYFSRTAIHEIYNFTFNLGLAGGIAAYMIARKRGHLIIASVSLICLFATKETTIITVCAVSGAALISLIFGKAPLPGPTSLVMEDDLDSRLKNARSDVSTLVRDEQKSRIGASLVFLRLYAVALISSFFTRFKIAIRYIIELVKTERKSFIVAGIVFLVIWVLLFSSLFTNPRGLGSFFEAFFRWGQTGTEGRGHQKPWSYFFTHLLYPYYRPLIYFGLPGLIWGSIKRYRLALFTTVWLVLALAAYSTIPYKTPWCVLSFSSPLFIGLGLTVYYAIRAIRYGSIIQRIISATALLAILGVLVPFSVPTSEAFQKILEPPKHTGNELTTRIRLLPKKLARAFFPLSDSWTINFKEYDVKGHPFIYVQNTREYLYLINDLQGMIETAQLDGDEKKPRILMIDAKNPMRWYLQKTGTQTWRKKFTDPTKKMIPDEVDIVCVSKKYAKEAKELLGGKIFKMRRYHERPGRKIDVYIRKTLWAEYEKAARDGLALEPSPPFQNKTYSQRRTKEMKEPWSRRGMN